MYKRYSIAEAQHNLAAIVDELEAQPVIELTRRGEPVAVLMSIDTYQHLQGEPPSFSDAYTSFRTTLDPSVLDDEFDIFEGVRDLSSGGDVQL